MDNYGKQIGKYAQNGQLKYDATGANVVLLEKEGKSYNKHTYFGGMLK